MAKMLWLLRHFEALETPPTGGRDRDRVLSPAGAEAAEVLAETLQREALPGWPPQLVLASTAARTQATAKTVFSRQAQIHNDGRLYHAIPDDVLEILREVPDEVDVLAIVGHNPTIQCLSLDLVDERLAHGVHPPASTYPPGMLTMIELPIASWSKVAFHEGALVATR